MKGFVPTPTHIVDNMVSKLFSGRPPRPESTVLDPGCGTGVFIEGIVRWCHRYGAQIPRIVGVESDSKHLPEARRKLGRFHTVTIENGDFLRPRSDTFDYIIGNPPYVPITGLSEVERDDFRRRYSTAVGRFDLYLLFFEQALRLLKQAGRLVFITPEKFLYVRTAAPLRRALGRLSIEEIQFVDEATFGDLVTYPTITTILNAPTRTASLIVARDRTRREARLGADGASWLPTLNGIAADQSEYALADACLRISCGVATGADAVFVTNTAALDEQLKEFALPTVAGREIRRGGKVVTTNSMLVPYARSGKLLAEHELGALGRYLGAPERRLTLLGRTCVAHKAWYAFHENPPLSDILRPKILCKDITAHPFFMVEATGEIIPRHSVYYLVPSDSSRIHELCDYLNSPAASSWLCANCQRAASGFLRLQSHVLKRMPVPADFVANPPLAWAATGVGVG